MCTEGGVRIRSCLNFECNNTINKSCMYSPVVGRFEAFLTDTSGNKLLDSFSHLYVFGKSNSNQFCEKTYHRYWSIDDG